MHMAQALLSDLCSICHSETPKYRCPRCKTHTCSLPCYKRHQQRAACSGKRDPAAYVKKNDLATPTGVDRDYNYLKTVERTIEDADKLTSQRGIGVEASTWRKATSSRQANSRLDKYLERNSITIERAPAGMSRQKTNRTRMTNAGNVQWTVEWVGEDGQRRIKDECLESALVRDLHTAVHADKMKAERRQLEESRWGQAKKRGLKRKRDLNPSESQRKVDEVSIQNEPEPSDSLSSTHTSNMADGATSVQDITENVATEAGDASTVDDGDQREGNESATAASPPTHILTESTHSQPSTIETKSQAEPTLSSEDSSNYTQNFYLLTPGTVSPTRVLIPLNPKATLTEALRNQTVQEYPTIYVLSGAPVTLGAEFMLEADYPGYLKKVASKHPESSADAGDSQPPTGSRGGRGGQAEKEQDDSVPLDAQSILKMLKRDVAL